jgi:hypothetical protein
VISNWEDAMPENPPYKIPIDPPPSPRAAQLLALTFALVAAVAGFLGYALIAGISAALSFVFGLMDILRTRGTVNVPNTMVQGAAPAKVDATGRR